MKTRDVYLRCANEHYVTVEPDGSMNARATDLTEFGDLYQRLRVHLVESGEYAVKWKKTMIREIRKQRGVLPGQPITSFEGAVEVVASFIFDEEVGVGGEVWPSHRTPYPTAIDIGDLDKLLRNLLDALTQSGLIKDDSQVAQISKTAAEADRAAKAALSAAALFTSAKATTSAPA